MERVAGRLAYGTFIPTIVVLSWCESAAVEVSEATMLSETIAHLVFAVLELEFEHTRTTFEIPPDRPALVRFPTAHSLGECGCGGATLPNNHT